MVTKRKIKQETIRKLKGYPTVADMATTNKLLSEIQKLVRVTTEKEWNNKRRSTKNAH